MIDSAHSFIWEACHTQGLKTDDFDLKSLICDNFLMWQNMIFNNLLMRAEFLKSIVRL